MQTTHGLLLLKLIDCVAAGSDLDGDENYQELRRKIGEFIVENRVPSQPEFAKLTEEADGIIGEYADEAPARAEVPEEHVAPAGLKSDVLRTAGPVTGGARRESAFRDSFALENRPEDDKQAEKRRESHDAEAGVAYVNGQNAPTPSDITAGGLPGARTDTPAAGETAVVQGGDGDDTDNEDDTNDDEGAGDEGGDDQEPDFEGSTKADLKAYLDERREAGDEKATYETDANKDTLVHLAREAYERAKDADDDGDDADNNG